MRKIHFLFLLLIPWSLLFPSNNAFYLTPVPNSTTNSYYLGFINGATKSTNGIIYNNIDIGGSKLSEILIHNVYLINSEPVIKSGDFDRDGTDEAMVLIYEEGKFKARFFNATPAEHNYYEDNTTYILFEYDLSNCKFENVPIIGNIKFVETIKDFNDNGSDDIIFIFEHTDGWHYSEIILDINANNAPSADSLIKNYKDLYKYSPNIYSYSHILERVNDNLIINVNLGDFFGDKRQFLNILYRYDGGYAIRTLDIHPKHIQGPNWVRKEANINFGIGCTNLSNAGYYLNSTPSKEQLCYVYKNSETSYTVRILDLDNLQSYSNTFYAVQPKWLLTGDFNSNGYEEPILIYNDTILAFNSTLSTKKTIAMGTTQINSVIIADFDPSDYGGLIKDEILVFHSSGFKKYYQNGFLWLTKIEDFDKANTMKCVIKAQSGSKVNAHSTDKFNVPIYRTKDTKDKNDKTFYIGWYEHDIQTTNIPFFTQTQSNTNALLNYLPQGTGLGGNLTSYINYITSFNTSNKKFFTPLYNNFLTYETQGSTWERDFDNLALRNLVDGYYIGDDFYNNSAAVRSNGYNELNFKKMYDYVVAKDNKYLFAAERSELLSDFYRSNFFHPQNYPMLIPMVENYIFRSSDGIDSRDYQMVGNCLELNRVNHDVLKYNQPGYIYISQAHGATWCTNNSTHNLRRASLYESWYDVFNSIIHGARGIFYWAHGASDNVTETNIKTINNELTTDNNFYNALKNGKISEKVFCNYDGFNKDYDDIYAASLTPKIGSFVNDINYIFRKDEINKNYYLIVANNSKNDLNNITFFLPDSITTDFFYRINKSETNDTKTSDFIYNRLYKGKNYKTITTNMEKFSIQIFKIGSGYPTPPPPPPGIEKASGNNLVNEFKMVQNYPNPFNPSTTIKYTIPNPGLVSLKIYDALGKEVATLVNEVKEVGSYDAIFDGSKFASGIYFYQIRYNGYTDTKKMLLIK